jgi:2-C-methyl-D-erythritol 4-phosphate cytidylyltransferase
MNYVIIAAGGKGKRFGGGKQLILLQGKPLIAWSLHVFLAEPEIEQVVLVYPQDESADPYRSVLQNPDKVVLVPGGQTRLESVRNGFKEIHGKAGDVVLIHDAARPLLSSTLLKRVLETASKKGAVVPVMPIAETVKEVEDSRVLRTLPRQSLWVAQTPQAFRYELLAKAYSRASSDVDATDEAMLVEMAGVPVFTVTGERENIKITDPADLMLAEFFVGAKHFSGSS